MKYAPYAEYVESDIPEIGLVPAGWSVGPLKRFVISLDARRVPLSSEERGLRAGQFPYYGASGIIDSVDSYLFDQDHVLVSEDGANLVSRTTPIAFVASGKYWVNNHAHILHPREGPVSYWAARIESASIATRVTGAAQPKLTIEALVNLPISAPLSPEVQWQIADFLDRETAQIDELIGKQNALIELLGERRKAVITRAVTRGLDPRVPMEPSGLSLVPEIPTGWTVGQLGRLAAIGNGSTPNRDRVDYWDGGNIPWLNSSNVNRSVVTGSDQFVTDVARAESHLPMVPEGSLLVGLTGEGKTRGMVTILGIRATINQHMAYITPRSETLQPGFLMWSLVHFYDALRELSNENGSTKGGLTCQSLKRFRVPLPPPDAQKQIIEDLKSKIAAIDLLVMKAKEFIVLARERRSALITAAVTGKIDVRGAV